MSRLQQIVKQIRTTGQTSPDVERYLQTGDAAALARITPATSGNWWFNHVLGQSIATPDKWTDLDRRLLHLLTKAGYSHSVGDWLDRALEQEKPEQDVHRALREELSGQASAAERIAVLTMQHVRTFLRGAEPNSAGRYVLGLSEPELKDLVHKGRSQYFNVAFVDFLLQAAPERLTPLMDDLLWQAQQGGNAATIAALLIRKGGARFEEPVVARFNALEEAGGRFHVACALADFDRDRYLSLAFETARAALNAGSGAHNQEQIAEWMLQSFAVKALPDIVAYLGQPGLRHLQTQVLSATVQALGQQALPAIEASFNAGDSEVALQALTHLLTYNKGAHDALIRRQLEQGLQEKSPNDLVRYVGLAGRWNPKALQESLWELLGHKSRPVREAAARALSHLGDEVLPKAEKLLQDRKAVVRMSTVTLLGAAGTSRALALLEGRIGEEADDDVRDTMLLGLEAAWRESGRPLTRADIDARIARAAPRLQNFAIAWIKEDRLPALKFQTGEPLGKDAVRYLLYRQGRAKEMRPDVEARPLYELIDRSTSGDFALAVLKGFLASKMDAGDRWALALAGLLGDDRVVPLLNQQIKQWADTSRGKMAEYAVQALALLGSDAALLLLDALAIRYRTKLKNIGKAAVEAFADAAQRLGVTPDELGDRVVPWLGLEPGKPRLIECGGKRLEARIGLDLKFKFHDLDKNKPVASLPKSAPKEVLAEFKELSAQLREVAKAQVLRLENLMVRQQRWPAARWRELFLGHPLLLPFAARLVWGVYNDGKLSATFRALEDRTLTTAGDEPFTLPDEGDIGIVHPLELDDAGRTAWLTHLADYEITPPFPQMERPVVVLGADQRDKKSLKEYRGTSLNAMTFRGRAEKLGWNRASVVDAGSINSYYKSFPTAGVDVFLGLDGMYIGIDLYSDIRLQDVYFARAGSIQIGSYTYDEPGNEQDPRVLSFGQVPPIVFSEAMGDLRKIAGQKAADED